MAENDAINGKRPTGNGDFQACTVNREPCAMNRVDTGWDDSELVLGKMTPDTKFLFDRMTRATIDAVEAKPGEEIIDLACGRATDAFQIALRGSEVFGLDPSDKMLAKAFEWIGPDKSHPVILIRGAAEKLPFPDNSFDKLVCKGALDHFADLDDSFQEMFRILKPGGKAIISVANFESLSCRLGRYFDRAYEKLKGRKRMEHPSWLPPLDHNFRFDCRFLTQKLKADFEIEMIQGLSLLWCTPYWGASLEKLNPKRAEKILKLLDQIAHLLPFLSDVLVVRARVKK